MWHTLTYTARFSYLVVYVKPQHHRLTPQIQKHFHILSNFAAMMYSRIVIVAVICFASLMQLSNGSRILVVSPSPSISHQVVFRSLALALNKRGHEIVVVTTDPLKDPTLKNYAEIDISVLYKVLADMDYVEKRGERNWFAFMKEVLPTYVGMSNSILNHTELKSLYAPDSKHEFDVLLIEHFWSQSLLPLGKRFAVPVIGIASMGLPVTLQYSSGNPILTSHNSNWELDTGLSELPSFWQRLDNFISSWSYLYWYRTVIIPKHNAISRKYFGDDCPDVSELERNVSLLLVNQQLPISYARPNIPKIIEIGGFHISKELPVMPEDLRKILDEATQGFVYMSLGSNIKSSMLSNETIHQFITAFSMLPYKVLWKYENDVLPGKPDNVHTMKWAPQQAVLAHPNLKVFVYQGGLQSTEEAVSHAVPLVGFPVYADQEMQVMKMASIGVAIKLEIARVDADELFQAVITVAGDSSYKQRMLDLRSIINDKPYDSLENAIWWTEFVIRHRGAPHLQSPTAEEPWYSRQDMDIVAFISAGSVIVLGLALMFMCKLFKIIHDYAYVLLHHTKEKVN